MFYFTATMQDKIVEVLVFQNWKEFILSYGWFYFVVRIIEDW